MAKAALRLSGMRRGHPEMGRPLRGVRRVEQPRRGRPRPAPPKSLGGSGGKGGQALDFVALRGEAGRPPRAPDRHRRVRPRVRRRAGAGLGDPRRRRPRHRQIDPAAAGRGGARGRRRRGCAYITGEEAIDQVRLRAQRLGVARGAGAACGGDQRARHRRLARCGRRAATRRHRLDPDHVSRHARQRAGHGQPGARRGAGADRPRQAPRHRAGAGRPRHQGRA